ncbi:MAG: MFS transporter [Alphaproteobacteria bacterium]|nr:MFS transporter [Alphaproteobacteria bacterium]
MTDSTESKPSTTGTLWQLVAILTGAFTLQIAGAALALAVPLRMALDGRPATFIGLAGSASAIGFLAGCLASASIVRPIGHIRAFAVLAAVQAVVTQLFALTDDPWLWVALRLVNGVVNAAQFVIVESWVNDRTPDSLRGRMMSIYIVCSRAGLILGQMLPLAFANAGVELFIAASAFYSLALIPVALNRAPSPAPPPSVAVMSLRDLFGVAPVSFVACFYVGMVGSAAFNVLPLYGVGIGLGNVAISMLAATVQLGSLIMQWPLGWLSDRQDRRAVMIGAAMTTVVGGLIVALAGGMPIVPLALVIAVAVGGCQAVYAIAVAHAFDFAGSGRTVALSSSLMLVWGVGASAGPLVAAAAVDRLGPPGLFVHAVVFSLVFVGFAIWRMTQRKPRPPEERERFVDLPPTLPSAPRLDPRAEVRPEGSKADAA